MEQNQNGKKGKEYLMRKSPPAWILQEAESRWSFSSIFFLAGLRIHQERPNSCKCICKYILHIKEHLMSWSNPIHPGKEINGLSTLCLMGFHLPNFPVEAPEADTLPGWVWKRTWIIFLSLTQTPPCTKWWLLPLENKIPRLCQCRKITEKRVAV